MQDSLETIPGLMAANTVEREDSHGGPAPGTLGIALAFLFCSVLLGPAAGGVAAAFGYQAWASIVAVLTAWVPILWWIGRQRRRFPTSVTPMWPQRLRASHALLPSSALPLVAATVTLFCLELGFLDGHFPAMATRIWAMTFAPTGDTLAQTAARAVVLILFIPYCEELFFRGVLLARLTARLGAAPALLLSSVFFALLHAEWLGHLLYGFTWGVIVLYTGRLLWAVLGHALLNGLVFYGSFVLKGTAVAGDRPLFLAECARFDALGYACAAGCAGFVVLLLRAYTRRRPQKA